ncbi:MAG: N-6 DNA methylase [Parabacteroides sp.]
MTEKINIRKLEADLWESADLLRAGSKLTSSQYCMPVLALLFLRYAYSRFKMVEAELLKNRPSRGGRVMPLEASDFAAKSALYLPREAQFDYLVNLSDDQPLGEAVNHAMTLVEEQSEQLTGILPKSYTMFSDELLRELLRIFNNKTLDEIGGDVIGRIYEYFLSKFAKAVASDDGVFFTPKSLVQLLVNVLEPAQGVMLDPACGSGGMFVQTGDFVNAGGMNANYLWISYFYAYLNDHGRAGFVMASSATDSANKDRDIREKLVLTGDVDVMVSVGNNFFYTLSLPCSLWFFDKAKRLENKNRVLFIDARNYYTVVDRTLNEWTEWQLRNLQAIVYLYRGEQEKYRQLVAEYDVALEGFSLTEAEAQLGAAKQIAKGVVANAQRKEKKQVEREMAEMIANCEDRLETARQREWLTSKFGIEGEYKDVPGLCKIATIDEIEEKNYSLTPGAYVGVAEVEDDGVDFHERMNEIHTELASLNKEANVLMNEIMKEWETLNTK